MRKGIRILEAGKSVLIFLLVAGILILGKQSGLFQQFSYLYQADRQTASSGAGDGTDGTTAENGSTPERFSQMSFPLVIAVTGYDASRYGAKYGAGVIEIYKSFSMNLGEALGSSNHAQEITAAAWEQALAAPGVFFDFFYEQDMTLLSQWLGAGTGDSGVSGFGARRICLAKDGERLSLYFAGTDASRYFRCETALSFSASIADTITEYPGNGAHFAFEQRVDSLEIDPYFLFLKDMPEIYGVRVNNPAEYDDLAQTLLQAFGMNIYTQPTSGSDGSIEYVENDVRLRILPDGEIRFRGNRPDISVSEEYLSPAQAVEAAGILINESAGLFMGSAELLLSELSQNPENMSYTVYFDYVITGIPVRITDAECAAEIEIANGMIQSAVIRLREYSLIQEHQLILPELQEAGIVGARGGGEPVLMYYDRGDLVSARWFITKKLSS